MLYSFSDNKGEFLFGRLSDEYLYLMLKYINYYEKENVYYYKVVIYWNVNKFKN